MPIDWEHNYKLFESSWIGGIYIVNLNKKNYNFQSVVYTDQKVI